MTGQNAGTARGGQAANGLGLGLGLGLGNGLGNGLGLGLGRGLGLGSGLGLGNGHGLGQGLGLGLGLGNGQGLGLGLGLGLGNGLGNGLGLGLEDNGYLLGNGADAGVGSIRSYYATPAELGLLPWTLDFTPDNAGGDPFPLSMIINPYQLPQDPAVAPVVLEWTTEDWDPALRFWALPFDPHLGEWLRAADRSEPATLAALEFASQPERWHPDHVGTRWLEDRDLLWRYQPGPTVAVSRTRAGEAFDIIKAELEILKMYMEDDRQQYLVECDVQADGLPAYLIHFLGANSFDHPFTLKLIDMGLALGNVAYMSYKAYFKRVRPSVLRPGLTVPFGPPAHPAFPSGHGFLAHFLSLLLLEIPGIAQRFGVVSGYKADGSGTSVQNPDGALLRKPTYEDMTGEHVVPSPLLTVAHRIAVNRERIGVHYPSDSMAGRHIAAGIWTCLMTPAPAAPDGTPWQPIAVPTLHRLLDKAATEWPTPWSAVSLG